MTWLLPPLPHEFMSKMWKNKGERRGHPLEVHLAVELRAQELVVGVVQNGKRRAILDAVRLEGLAPEEHGDDRA